MAGSERPTAAFRTKWEAVKDTGILSTFTLRGLKMLDHIRREGGSRPHLLYNLHAYNYPGKTAFLYGDRAIAFGELLARVNRLANALYKMGVRPGDRVAMMLKNSPEYLEVQTACAKIGAAAVFVNWRLTPPEIEYIVNNSGASALLYDHDFAAAVEAARDRFENIPKDRYVVLRGAGVRGDRAYEDLLAASSASDPPSPGKAAANNVVIYTSGTTGRPKGAVRNLAKAGIGEILNFLQVVPVRHSDVHLVCAPMYHATATGLGTANFVFGATLAIMEKFRPEDFLAAIHRYGVTSTAMVPTMLGDVLSLPDEVWRKYDVRSMRTIVTTGSPLTDRVRDLVVRRFGPDVLYDLYGSTEMAWVTIARPEDHRLRRGTIGRPVPGTEVVLLKDDGTEAATDELGEIYARNNLLIEGYHGNEEATRKSRWRGYFSVGDIGRRDAEGYYYICDRKSDMVISGGANIYPAEIEAVLARYPGLREIAVVGVPDERWGERLVAFAAMEPGAALTEESAVEFCRDKLAGYRIPREYVLMETLPRASTGKVDKRALKRDYLAKAGA